MIVDPLERVDLGVQVAGAHPGLEQVVGQVLGHLLGQRRHERALADLLAPADLVQQVVDLVPRRPQLDLGVDDARWGGSAARRRESSGAAPTAPGVAETKTICGTLARNSSKRSGRLSSAEGSRKPKSTSVCLRERSPSYMPPIWGTVWCDSSTKTTKSDGK